MVDLKRQYSELKNEIDEGILQALADTKFILGPAVKKFEEDASKYLGVKHAIGVASGTDALHLALAAADIGSGDEVITTPFTFIATAEAISYVGAKPIFVDINHDTFNLDLDKVEQAITNKTKAIIPVHLFGQPVDMPKLSTLCDSYNLTIVEDCAQSFGASIDSRQTGSFGDFGAFSFFPSKNLGCYGDGGLISTSSDKKAEKIRFLRNHGMSKPYHHTMLGFNSRLDELQAVILNIKLLHIDSYNKNRRQVAKTYNELLQDTSVQTPIADDIGVHVYHQFTCLHPKRDLIIQVLKDSNIACAIYYPIPLHLQSIYRKAGPDINLPNSELAASQCFSLPIYPELDEDKIGHITDVIKKALA